MTRRRISRVTRVSARTRRPFQADRLPPPPIEPLPYERRKSLLSQGELAFYRVLRQVVDSRHTISIKTRLADVVKCPPELWDTIHGRRLSQKHVDFVVYEKYSAAIHAIVELDDQSHQAADRRVRDAFVDRVLRSLGIAIVRVRAASRYDPDAIRRQLDRECSR